MAWRVLAAACTVWLLLVAAGGYGLLAWFHTATVPAPATLRVLQGIVLLQERTTAPLLNARDGMAMQEGDALEVKDNSLARLQLPGHATVHLGPDARVILAALRAGRFNQGAGRLELEHTAGAVRVEVVDDAPRPLSLETPYGTVVMGGGDYVVAVKGPQGPRAEVLVREGTATVLVGDRALSLAMGERAHLAPNAPPAGPLQGPPNLLRNGDFAADQAGWQAKDAQESNRPDRPGQRALLSEVVDGALQPVLRISRDSLFETHNETGLVQELNADVAVYPQLVLSARVNVRFASLSGGGYLGTEYPLMLRLRYRDAAGNGQTWYRGFYYQNPEWRPTEHGELVPQDTWTRFSFDLAQLPERPVFLYALEVLGAGHDFDALVTDVQLVAQ